MPTPSLLTSIPHSHDRVAACATRSKPGGAIATLAQALAQSTFAPFRSPPRQTQPPPDSPSHPYLILTPMSSSLVFKQTRYLPPIPARIARRMMARTASQSQMTGDGSSQASASHQTEERPNAQAQSNGVACQSSDVEETTTGRRGGAPARHNPARWSHRARPRMPPPAWRN
jgi:hypothetical protein